MTSYPLNPARSLRLMEIAIELEWIQSESIFAHSIRLAIKNGRVAEIVKEIYQQSHDNYPLVADIVGYKTLNKILCLY